MQNNKTSSKSEQNKETKQITHKCIWVSQMCSYILKILKKMLQMDGGDCHFISEEQAMQDQLVGRRPQRSTGRRYLPTGDEDADMCPRRRE